MLRVCLRAQSDFFYNHDEEMKEENKIYMMIRRRE